MYTFDPSLQKSTQLCSRGHYPAAGELPTAEMPSTPNDDGLAIGDGLNVALWQR